MCPVPLSKHACVRYTSWRQTKTKDPDGRSTKNSKYRITLHVAPETMVACGHCLLGLAFMRLALVQPYDEMAYRRWTGVSVLSSHILPMCDLMKRTHRNRRDIRHVSSGSGMRREPIVNDLGNGIRLSINVDKRGRSVAASRRRQTR